MNHQLISILEKSSWNKVLQGIKYSYAHRLDYCIAMSKSSELETFLYVAEDSDNRVVCPLNIRKKEDGYPELVSPYGMGGFVTSNSSDKLFGFRDIWLNYFFENGFVTSYIMQHPLFSLSKDTWNGDLYESHCQYIIDLTFNIEDIWSKMGKIHRYEVRRFGKGLDFEVITDRNKLKKALLELYPQTVERVNASNVYHFSSSTLEQLAELPDSLLVGVEDESGIQAIALFLYTPWVGDYFLNASSIDGRKYTRLLIWKAIEILKQHNIACLNLGGGVKPGDSLDQFKRRFGGRMVKIQVIKQIINQEKYYYLCRKYYMSDQLETQYFPPYWKNN